MQQRERAVGEVVAALESVLGPDLRGVIVKGSAVKGDFFPFWSDLDVHVFVGGAAMEGPRRPRAATALALQRTLGSFDAGAYQAASLQLYCLQFDAYPPDWLKPLPGTYELVRGRLPDGFEEIDEERYRVKAADDHAACVAFLRSRAENVIDKPHGELAKFVRRIGIDMKVLAYVVPILRGGDPAEVWRWPLRRALEATGSSALAEFFGLIDPWPADIPRARRMIELALEVADAA